MGVMLQKSPVVNRVSKGDILFPPADTSVFPDTSYFVSLHCVCCCFFFFLDVPRSPQRSALSVLLFYCGTPRCWLHGYCATVELLYVYTVNGTSLQSPKWDKGRQGTGKANGKKNVLNRRLRKKNDIEREAYNNWQ